MKRHLVTATLSFLVDEFDFPELTDGDKALAAVSDLLASWSPLISFDIEDLFVEEVPRPARSGSGQYYPGDGMNP